MKALDNLFPFNYLIWGHIGYRIEEVLFGITNSIVDDHCCNFCCIRGSSCNNHEVAVSNDLKVAFSYSLTEVLYIKAAAHLSNFSNEDCHNNSNFIEVVLLNNHTDSIEARASFDTAGPGNYYCLYTLDLNHNLVASTTIATLKSHGHSLLISHL